MVNEFRAENSLPVRPSLSTPTFLLAHVFASATRTTTLATRTELSDFLASVEKRAFKQALFAMRDEEAALDAVQESMLRLSQKYCDRPPDEFPMLFQRILQNAIRDWMRRSKVRSMWTTLLSAFSGDDETDPLENFLTEDPSGLAETPQSRLEREQTLLVIEEAIKKLPARQREAFLMRYWEDMDIEETAAAMGCSEGSVKTHCHRATHALAHALRSKGIAP